MLKYILLICVFMLNFQSSFAFEFRNHNQSVSELANLRIVSEKDMEDILTALSSDTPYKGFSETEWLAVRNDALILVLRQPQPPTDLIERYCEWFRKSENAAWRNYLIQHADGLLKPNCDKNMEVFKLLYSATALADAGLSSTACLVFSRVEKDKLPNYINYKKILIRILSSVNYSDSDKATCINLISKEDSTIAVDFARKILLNPKNQKACPSVPLQMAALNVLGTYGAPSDEEILNAFAKSSEFRLKYAARAALSKNKK